MTSVFQMELMNECLTTPQHEKQIGYWVVNAWNVWGFYIDIASLNLDILNVYMTTWYTVVFLP